MSLVADPADLPETSRRELLLGLLFGSAAAIAAWRQPSTHLDYLGHQKLDDLVPKAIGPWKFVAASGLIVPPEDQLSRTLYSQLLTRVYSDEENSPVMLLIAQSAGQTGILQVHRPEICYPAGGFQISPLSQHNIAIGSKSLPTNRLSATRDGQTEQIVYWTRVGDRIPRTWKQQKIDTAEENLQGIIPDAVLVRISVVNSDAEAAQLMLDSFTRALIASIAPARRSVFIV